MRKLGWLLFFLAVALAQGYTENRLTTYDIRTLSVRPGVIYISPKYLTVVEFADLIDEVGTSAPDLVKVTVSSTETMLILQANRIKGSGDLVVRVGGRVALFRLVVDPEGTLPRRYVITFPQVPASYTPAYPNPAPAPKSGPPGGEAPKPSIPQTPPQTPAQTPKPPEGKVTYAFTPTLSPSGGLILYYQVTNGTREVLELKASGIQVTKGSTSLPFRLLRTLYGDSPDHVGPGETAGGAIIIEGADGGVQLEWKASLGGQPYTLRWTGE